MPTQPVTAKTCYAIRGCSAFSGSERRELGIEGLLPPASLSFEPRLLACIKNSMK